MPTQSLPRLQLLIATLVRLVVNTAHRMIYPFLPEFSRGLGVAPEQLALVLSARGALGMTAPAFGFIPARLGNKRAMLIGVGVFCFGMALIGLFASYPLFFAAILLVAVSKFIFDPAMQAYLSERTPYTRRGLVIAFSELGWSGAYLVGVPLMSLLIAAWTWRAPFFPLLGLGVLMGATLWAIFPRPAGRPAPASVGNGRSLAGIWRNPAILGALSIGPLISAANESLNAVYGRWMEDSFQLSIVALGSTTLAIGLAELAGEGLVMGLADRLGKRRAILIGLVASALAYLALPFVAGLGLPFALAALFFVFVAFEFVIVATIPMVTELLPEARALMMSVNVAGHGAGRMLGAALGSWLFQFGFAWNGLAALALNLLTLVVVLMFVRERHDAGVRADQRVSPLGIGPSASSGTTHRSSPTEERQ
jgi:predicted MFS family arabinose efflux permease